MTSPINSFLVICMVAAPVELLAAQTFTNLHSFTGADGGATPQEPLARSGNTLYGTASGYWGPGNGIIFAVNSDGTGFQTLHVFSPPSDPTTYINDDGAIPIGGLVVSSNILYGTTWKGGNWGDGVIFAINTDGTGFKVLHHFNGDTDGSHPRAHLLLSGNMLYGTASEGGASGFGGTIFALNIDGTDFTVLHNFKGTDGSAPMSALILSGGVLFGTANNGGPTNDMFQRPIGLASFGTVFSLKIDGSGFASLHSFISTNLTYATNADGENPGNASLVLAGDTLYGTTFLGGASGNGTVFKLSIYGTAFATLHTFAQGSSNGLLYNPDGAQPANGVILSGRTLYGTTIGGGTNGTGTIFALNTDGTGFTSLYQFSAGTLSSMSRTNGDGVGPAGLLLSDNNQLYGVASTGGLGYGTIFRLSPPPELTASRAVGNVILSWPSSATGFVLKYSTNLTDWMTVVTTPMVVNGQNTVNVITDKTTSGACRFYQLSR